MNTKTGNPYVGPRTFQENERDRFFGREREARDLLALAVSEQLVLFYAQSGAGKSSLVNTCLIPDLRNKGFEIFSGRVIGDAPTGIDIDNIYVFNLIRSLFPGNVNLDWLARMTLSEYFLKFSEDTIRTDPESGPRPHALIIDQFEELFNTHHEAWEKREVFFQQIAHAMEKDRYLWVILVMREDFIAALDPYAYILPGRLRMRYYMQRLERDSALEAIKKPVMKLRPFEGGAAETLVDNLARIKVKLPDGDLEEQPGQYVEPVQLQVVCYSLWEHLEEGLHITEDDLHKVGDVNQALEKFYDGRVQAVSKDKKVEERQIREWFDQEMITSSGTRNMVLRNPKDGSQLGDEVIQALQGDLVRAEMRAGQTWYELSHDRLIEPIQTSNAKWFAANLSIFQQQAALWAAQGRPDGMLLRGKELELAEIEQGRLVSESKTVPKDEIDFLAACTKARDRERREKRGNLLVRMLAIGATIFLFIAIGLAFLSINYGMDANNAKQTAEVALVTATHALYQKDEALGEVEEVNKKLAEEQVLKEAEALAGQSQIALDQSDSVQLGRLLSVEAYRKNKEFGKIIPSVYQALFNSVKGDNLPISNKPFSLAAFSPENDTNWLILDNVLWNLKNRQWNPLDLDSNPIVQSAFQSDEKLTLVTWDYNNYSDEPFMAYIVDVNNQSETRMSLSYGEFISDSVYLSAGGRWIITSGTRYGKSDTNSAVLRWDVKNPTVDPLLYEIAEKELAQSIAITDDGTMLAVATESNLYVWRNDEEDLYNGTRTLKPDSLLIGETFQNGTFSGKSGNGLQISPDGAWLARLTNNKIHIHKTGSVKEANFTIPVKDTIVHGFLFSPANNALIYVTGNYQSCSRGQACKPSASVFQFSLEGAAPTSLEIYKSTTADITVMDITRSGKLVIGDENGYIRVWDLTGGLSSNQSPQTITSAHAGKIEDILIGPDSQTVISASGEDGTRLWKLTEGVTDAVLINRISNKISTVLRNNEDTLVIGGINTENNAGNVHVYSGFQSPDQSQLKDDSYDSGTGSALSKIAVSQNWIAAARTYKPYSFQEAAYYLDFWNRSSEMTTSQAISFKLDSEVSGLAFYPDGTYLAIASRSGEIWMDKTEDLERLRIALSSEKEGEAVDVITSDPQLPNEAQLPNDLENIQNLLFAGNGRYLIAASAVGVRIWDMQKLSSGIYPVPEATSPILLSMDQQWLVAAGMNNSVQILDLQSLSQITFTTSDQTAATRFAFNPAGDLLAVVNKSGQISIYSFPITVSSPVPLHILRGAAGDITWSDFRPGPASEQWLAASGGDTVYLWNLSRSKEKPITLKGYNGNVIYVGFTNDGQWIITVAEDQTIRFWSMDLEKLRLAACEYAERNLRLSEWERYFSSQSYDLEHANTCPEFNYGLQALEKVEGGSNPAPIQTLPFVQFPTATPKPEVSFVQYTVLAGDTLDLIAQKFNINRSVLMADNNISDPNLIFSGQVLNIKVINTPVPP